MKQISRTENKIHRILTILNAESHERNESNQILKAYPDTHAYAQKKTWTLPFLKGMFEKL